MLLVVLIVNVFLYLAMTAATGEFSWDGDILLAWGGNLGQLSLHGEPWRLLTATYLHVGIQHLVGNMGLLAVAGIYLEPWIGSIWAITTYTACGLAGSIASAIGHADVVSVGASGAIAGLMGVLTVLYFASKHRYISGRWLAQVLSINAIYSIAPDVDTLAHIGGFAAGLIGGTVFAVWPTRRMRSLDQLVGRTEVTGI